MADFTADPTQMTGISSQLRNVGGRIDSVASAAYSTSNNVGSVKSLKNKGYVGMINGVRSSLRHLADEVRVESTNLSQIADSYSAAETKVRKNFASDVLDSSTYSNKSRAAVLQNESSALLVDGVCR